MELHHPFLFLNILFQVNSADVVQVYDEFENLHNMIFHSPLALIVIVSGQMVEESNS